MFFGIGRNHSSSNIPHKNASQTVIFGLLGGKEKSVIFDTSSPLGTFSEGV